MCWKCKKDINSDTKITRSSTCPVCGSDLHCCKNCVYFSPGSHYDCHEDVDELVTDKERSNFCDYFKAKLKFDSSSSDKNQKAIDAFNALFS